MQNSPTKVQGIGGRPEPIDQLERLMADVESFLGDWLRRLEQLHAVSPTPDAQLSNRMRELELEKSLWEAKRHRETRDIHEKAEELTKAWLRLEEEQRRFLQIRDARAHGHRIPVADNPPREAVVDTEPTSDHPSSPARSAAPTATVTPTATATTNLDRGTNRDWGTGCSRRIQHPTPQSPPRTTGRCLGRPSI